MDFRSESEPSYFDDIILYECFILLFISTN
jgi:hypothetical protein